jgi:serine kinase of HPr protein (carbohydrate metabolism regulator)
MALVHASSVAIEGAGVLLCGAPGCGKSDLALRLIDRGARLIADDQVVLRRAGERVIASAPAALCGLIEVRGIGLVRIAPLARAPLVLVVDLDPGLAPERLPEPASRVVEGVALPCLTLAPFHASAAARLRLAVEAIARSGSLAGALGEAGR